MAKELRGKKLDSVREQCLKNISKNIAKILNGKEDKNTFMDLIQDVINYNVYDTKPSLFNQKPMVSVEIDENVGEGVRGSYAEYGNEMWINTKHYNIEAIKKDPSMLTDLICTISHEMRHWYQSKASLEEIQNDTEELVLSGKDDKFFEEASKAYGKQQALDTMDFYHMYRNASREELLEDIRLIKTGREKVLIGEAADKDNPDLEFLNDKDDDYLRGYLALKLNWAQYSSMHVELDARLTGTAESVNLISALKHSKNKEAKKWAEGVDIHSLIEKEVENEEGNYDSLEGYTNYTDRLSIQRLELMMEGINSNRVFEIFKQQFLANRPEEELQELFTISAVKGNTILSSDDYEKVSKEKLLEIYKQGTFIDTKGNELEISPQGYANIVSLLKGEIDSGDIIKKAQELFLEGKFEHVETLKDSLRYNTFGFDNIIRVRREINNVVLQNVDKMCQFIREGRATEKVIGNYFGSKNPFSKELNDARLGYVNNIQQRIDQNKIIGRDVFYVTREMLENLTDFISKFEEDGDRLDNENITDSFEVINQYCNTLTTLIQRQRENLTDKARADLDKYLADDKLDDAYEQYQKDDELIKEIFDKLHNLPAGLNFAINSADMMGLLSARIESLREILIIDENTHESESENSESADKEADEMAEQEEAESEEPQTESLQPQGTNEDNTESELEEQQGEATGDSENQEDDSYMAE